MARDGFRTVAAPEDGLYRVLYVAIELDTCVEETLSRLVPRPHLAELVRQQWQDLHFMDPGAVAREWRNDRRIVRATVPDDARFVDVDHPDTLATLERLTRPHCRRWAWTSS